MHIHCPMDTTPLRLQNEIVLQELVGEGATGWVYRAERRDSQNLFSQTIALKVFKSQRHIAVFQNEVGRLLDVKSPYCVSIFGWETLEKGPAILMEWVEGVSLTALNLSLTEEQITEIQRQVMLGLEDLESRGLCHGDLSPSNILIDKLGQVRLIDFGLACLKGEVHEPDEEPYGTLQFLSPERWKGEGPTIFDDYYSLGQITMDLQSGLIGTFMGSDFWRNRAMASEFGQGLTSRQPELRKVEIPKKNARAIEELARVVKSRLTKSERGAFAQTKIRIQQLVHSRLAKRWVVRAASFALLLTFSTSQSSLLGYGKATLQIRSNRWIQISLSQRALGYAPLEAHGLSSGVHQLSWSTATDHGQFKVVLKDKETLVLTEEHFF